MFQYGLLLDFNRDRQDSQDLTNDTFCWLPITSAQCIISTEEYPDPAILLNYDDDDYNQIFGPIKEAFKALTKDDILEPYISEQDFRTSNYVKTLVKIYTFSTYDISKIFESAQPIKVEFNFSGNFDAGIYGYALMLTNRLISISSDGQRHFISI